MDHLLDELARRTGCLYLSDLHDPAVWRELRRVLRRFPSDDYPAHQWAEALDYLASQPHASGTPEQLCARLLRALGEP